MENTKYAKENRQLTIMANVLFLNSEPFETFVFSFETFVLKKSNYFISYIVTL